MKEFKGTKGEWKSFFNGYFNEIQLGGTGQFLASTNENKFIDIDDEQDNANAKLIAAAPDLLEVLIKVKKTLKPEWNKWEWAEFDKEIGYTEAINKALN